LGEIHQRRGQFIQEMKSLAEGRRLGEAKLELGCVEQRLEQAVHRWRVLAVCSLVLESIRDIYETQRQPETLTEASTYLEQLTAGRYTRVWTPLGERVLRVDDAQGNSLPVDVLSRGTREALLLCLRLALIAGYSRRGAVLPMVLDDVLVNFDAQRAKAAALVLRDFAKSGHQLLLFTCHEHIMKIFKSAKVEVRTLPDYAATAEPVDEVEAIEFEQPVIDDEPQIDEPDGEADEIAEEVEDFEEIEQVEPPDDLPEEQPEIVAAHDSIAAELDAEQEQQESEFSSDSETEEQTFAGLAAFADDETITDDQFDSNSFDSDQFDSDPFESDMVEEVDELFAQFDEQNSQRHYATHPSNELAHSKPSFTWESPEMWWDNDPDDAQ
jgi:hypothetical protein